MISRALAHIRRRMVQGVLLVLPLVITVWLVGLLIEAITLLVAPWVRKVLAWAGVSGLEGWIARLGIPVASLLVTLAFIYILGLLGGNLAGRRLVRLVESFILRIPLVKGIYGSARQLLDAFSVSGARAFSRVVLLEYPRNGLWTVGFVTTEVEHQLDIALREHAVTTVPVFLPTTPNPTSGWMILVPTGELLVLDLTVEEGIKLIVSGGIVSPDDLGDRISPWPAGLPAPGQSG